MHDFSIATPDARLIDCELQATSHLQPALQHELLRSPHLVQQTVGVDHLRPALIQRRDAQQAHARLQLLSQDCDMLAHPLTT
jgi:hypothetical protein